MGRQPCVWRGSSTQGRCEGRSIARQHLARDGADDEIAHEELALLPVGAAVAVHEQRGHLHAGVAHGDAVLLQQRGRRAQRHCRAVGLPVARRVVDLELPAGELHPVELQRRHAHLHVAELHQGVCSTGGNRSSRPRQALRAAYSTFGDGAQVQHTGPAAAQLYAHDRWALRRVKAFARRHRLLEEPLDHLLRDHASCRKRGRTSEQRVELLAGCSKAASPAY